MNLKATSTARLVLMVIFLVLGLAVIAAATWARPAAPHAYYQQLSRFPLVIAHQGGDGLRPGDTLAAFQHAADLGVDVLEMDIHRTQDGVLVVMHDATLERTTDGSGAIQDMTLEQLKQLDAGYDWSPDGGQTHPFRGQGITIPTLEEVFQAFPNYPMTIEIKQAGPPIHTDLCHLIRQYGKQDQVLIASFHDGALRAFRLDCPEVATSLSSGEVRPFVYLTIAYLGRFYRPEGHALQVPLGSSGITIVTPNFMRTAHERGLRVETWTIDDPAEMQRLVEMGVDGIITDYPNRLLEVLGR